MCEYYLLQIQQAALCCTSSIIAMLVVVSRDPTGQVYSRLGLTRHLYYALY